MRTWFRNWFTPMTLIERNRFRDMVSGYPIHMYRDAYGRRCLAEHSRSWFRVYLDVGKL